MKDNAIPPAGRQVRCASCQHRWHQDPAPVATADAAADAPQHDVAPATPPVMAQSEMPAAADPYAAFSTASPPAERMPVETVDAALSESHGFEPPLVDAPFAPPVRSEVASMGYAPLAAEPQVDAPTLGPAEDDEPRLDDDLPVDDAADDWTDQPYVAADAEAQEMGSGRRWPVLLLVLLLLVAAGAGLSYYLGGPALLGRLGLATGQSAALEVMVTANDRQKLAGGNELLAVSGRIINPTGSEQPVPPLTAELRDAAGKTIYQWTIAPPAATLAPGASASFNSAEMNVPQGGDRLTVRLGTPA